MDADFYHELEQRLDAILRQLAELLPDEIRRTARKYVDVGEYGLAPESIVYGLLECRSTISSEMHTAISNLARLMDLPDSDQKPAFHYVIW